MLRRQEGFTLLELVLSLAAITMLMQGYFLLKEQLLAEKAVQRTVEGFVLIDEAAYGFHVENARWPTSLAELRDPTAPLLPVVSGGVDPLVNGVGGRYLLAVIAPDLGIQVTTTMQSHDEAVRVQRAFPHRTLPVVPGSADVVVEQRVSPKDSFDHQKLVWRDGSLEMQGNLNFDGFQARNVRRLGFRNGETVGGSCTARDIASDIATGELLECPLGTLQWRQVGGASDVECMWTGWKIVNVVGWFQDSHVTPPGRPQGTVMASWCESGKTTHIRSASCSSYSLLDSGSQPDWSLSDCPALANPP